MLTFVLSYGGSVQDHTKVYLLAMFSISSCCVGGQISGQRVLHTVDDFGSVPLKQAIPSRVKGSRVISKGHPPEMSSEVFTN